MSSKSILTISTYTVSMLVQFSETQCRSCEQRNANKTWQ